MKFGKTNHSLNTVIVALLIFFVSCKSQGKKDFLLSSLSESLENSTLNVEENNFSVYNDIKADFQKPESRYKAEIWLPVASKIKKLSDSFVLSINKLKNNVQEKEKWEQLFKELKSFQSDLSAVDSLVYKQFNREIEKISKPIDSLKENNIHIIDDFSRLETHAFLDVMENKIRLVENDLLTFCYLNIPQYSDRLYNKFSIIWGATATHYKKGDSLEMYAGVGAFSTRSNPKIQIEGKDMDLGSDGKAVYKEKVSGKPGKYYKQLKIEYTDDDGKRMTLSKKMEFVIDK